MKWGEGVGDGWRGEEGRAKIAERAAERYEPKEKRGRRERDGKLEAEGSLELKNIEIGIKRERYIGKKREEGRVKIPGGAVERYAPKGKKGKNGKGMGN